MGLYYIYCFQREPHCFRSGPRNFHPVWWFTYHILPHIGQALQPTFRSHRSQNHLGVVAVTLGCAIGCCELLKFGGMITQLTWTSVSLGRLQKIPKTLYSHIPYRFNLSTVASTILLYLPLAISHWLSPIGYLPLAKCQKSSTQLSSSTKIVGKNLAGFATGSHGTRLVPRHPWRQIVRRCHWREALRAAWADCNLQTSKPQKRRALQNNLRLFKMVMISCCSEISI